MSRNTYLLVPGAWHGGWCWHRVAERLQSAGHRAIALDLPGCAQNDSQAATITLEHWVRAICEGLEQHGEPAILVGHSRGGIVISQVAERVPERVSQLVYVSGFLLRGGQSVLRALREDGTSPFLRSASLAADRSRWVLEQGSETEMFYDGCSAEDARLAVSKLGTEPAAPMMTPLRLSEAGFGRVPRTYVECLRDAAVPLGLQRKMQASLPCSQVFALDTGHAPFLSDADELAAVLSRCGLNHP